LNSITQYYSLLPVFIKLL